MGMFDSVYVPCPKCGHRNEFQSKSGDCSLMTYNFEEAPREVLVGIVGDEECCKGCLNVYTAPTLPEEVDVDSLNARVALLETQVFNMNSELGEMRALFMTIRREER